MHLLAEGRRVVEEQKHAAETGSSRQELNIQRQQEQKRRSAKQHAREQFTQNGTV